jgi:hypothetical protein
MKTQPNVVHLLQAPDKLRVQLLERPRRRVLLAPRVLAAAARKLHAARGSCNTARACAAELCPVNLLVKC